MDNIEFPEKDVGLTLAEYLLNPEVPATFRKEFEKLSMTFSKIMALSNIERYDILALLKTFDQIKLLNEMRLYEEARSRMARLTMEMQLSRGIGGFWTLYGQRGVERKEEIQKLFDNRPGTKGTGVLGMFRRKEKPDQGAKIGAERQ